MENNSKNMETIKTAEELGQRPCEFQPGQFVKMKDPDLHGNTTGKVLSVERMYQAIDEDGQGNYRFQRGGLCTRECDISHIKIPYEFDGEVLSVHYPEQNFTNFIQKPRVIKSRFKGYSVTVMSRSMSTIYSETSLIK